MKRIHSAVIGALALTVAGASLAAGNTMGSSSSSDMSSSSASAQAPDLSKDFKSTDLIGMNVSNRQNQNLGSISNLIVDSTGKVAYVVLNDTTSATPGNKYIVPWSRVQLTPGQNVATVDVDRNALPSEFAAFDESMTAPVTGSTPQSAPGSSGSMSNPPPASSGSSSTPPPSGSSGAGGNY